MKEKYKITEEEINQTILHSPYSLADSPASVGLKAKQIKKYFYEFIRFFANKINIHLNDLGETLENYDELCQAFELIPDLQEKDNELGEKIIELLSAHDGEAAAHPYLKEKISNDISSHNGSVLSHADIRKLVKSIEEKLDVAYSLASGKSRVFSCEDVVSVLEAIDENEICKGDLLLVADPQMPDFTVFEIGLPTVPSGSVELDYSSISSGEIQLEAGKSYYYNGVRMISSVGTLETNLLAKNKDLEELENSFFVHKENTESRIEDAENTLLQKEDKTKKKIYTSGSVTLEGGTEYDLGTLTELIISLPEGVNELEAFLVFRTGATVPTVDAPASLIFSGDDTYGGRFYPIAHRIYEISVKEVMGVLSARVGATDFEVIE